MEWGPFDYRPLVLGARFRRAFWGYRPKDVHKHLDRVAGWFSLAGLDKLLDERLQQLAADAERWTLDAENEAAALVGDARREAAEIRAAARDDARAIIEQARRHAAIERRGRSRVGRPMGEPFDSR
jgi:cell division septum initiation protein DivIVA